LFKMSSSGVRVGVGRKRRPVPVGRGGGGGGGGAGSALGVGSGGAALPVAVALGPAALAVAAPDPFGPAAVDPLAALVPIAAPAPLVPVIALVAASPVVDPLSAGRPGTPTRFERSPIRSAPPTTTNAITRSPNPASATGSFDVRLRTVGA
jgi:hypothetical protein